MKDSAIQPKTRPLVAAVKVVLGFTALAAAPLMAQQLQLEEVVVTAQKRTESLQDVPVAVTAISGQKIAEAGIRDLVDLVDYVPNVAMTRTAGGGNPTRIFIRGVGSGNNVAFEQSVGLFVDGVYTGRARQFLVPFLDVQSVEVLKGPQGALFGKNTVAGAMIINSARPTDELEGELRAQYEFEEGSTEYVGVVSGPIVPGLSGRLAATFQEDEGFMDNLIRDTDEPNIESTAIRGSLLWDVNDVVQAFAKVEYADQEVTGTSNQMTLIDGNFRGLVDHRDVISPLETGKFDEENTQLSWNEEGGDTDGINAVIQIDWELSDSMTFTSLTGYSEYDSDSTVDPDMSDVLFVEQTTFEDFEQFSQEFRLSSDAGGDLEYIAGIYLETQELKSNAPVSFSFIPLSSQEVPGSPLPPAELGSYSPYEQDGDTVAVFGEINWRFADAWSLRAGLRYSVDDKDAELETIVTERGSSEPTDDPLLILLAGRFLDLNNAVLEDDDDWENVSWSANLTWDYSDDGMAYFRVANGFKSGGFNPNLSNGNPDEFPFDEEEVNSAELGAKMTLLDGAANLNFAAFYTEFDDLQVSSFRDNGFVVGNAAESTSKGFEVEGRILLNEHFDLAASLAYLDSEYDDYPGAPCTYEQDTAEDPEAAGCIDGTTNLKGETAGRAPDWSGSFVVNFNHPIGDTLDFRASVDLLYEDELNRDTNPNYQDDYTKINARMAVISNRHNWELAVIGRNLTDETTYTNGAGVPFFTGSWFKGRTEPRTVAVEASYRF